MFYSPFQQHHSAPEIWVQSAHVELLLSLSTFQNLLRYTHHHCWCAEFSAFCLLTFQLEKTWEDFILVFQDIYPDVAGIVINKWSVLLHSGTWHSSYYTHHYAPIPGVHLVTCLRQLGTYFCGVFLPRMTRRKRFPLTYLNHSYQPIFPWPTFAGSVLQGGHITDAKYLPLFLCSC